METCENYIQISVRIDTLFLFDVSRRIPFENLSDVRQTLNITEVGKKRLIIRSNTQRILRCFSL